MARRNTLGYATTHSPAPIAAEYSPSISVAYASPGVSAIRGLAERTAHTPGKKWAEMDAVPHGDLGTIFEWASAGNGKPDIPLSEMSGSVVAGAGFEPATFRL